MVLEFRSDSLPWAAEPRFLVAGWTWLMPRMDCLLVLEPWAALIVARAGIFRGLYFTLLPEKEGMGLQMKADQTGWP